MPTIADLLKAARERLVGDRSAEDQLRSFMEKLSRSDRPKEASKQNLADLLATVLHLCDAIGWDPLQLLAQIETEPSEAVRADTLPATPSKRRIALYTGSFDPPMLFHHHVVEKLLARGFDEVVIRPDGARADGSDNEREHATPIHRAVMTDLAFRDLPKTTVELADLDNRVFTPHSALEKQYSLHGEVWNVVSDTFITHGRTGHSIIQERWKDGPELWAKSRFAIFHSSDSEPNASDLPPHSMVFTADGYLPTADLRSFIYNGGQDAADGLVVPPVLEYIHRQGLFTSTIPPVDIRVKLDRPRFKIIVGPQDEAAKLAETFRHLESPEPNFILVIGGDGTMLHAIRENWRSRLPFLGLNAGHLGYLMNEGLDAKIVGSEMVLHRMPMLRVDTVREDGSEARALAFNDAWVERDSGQGAWLRVDVNGEMRVQKVVADGLLIATPSGSAAYARAMGGTPVPLNSPVITLAGSNVFHPRFWKPVALPDTAIVRMTSIGDPAKRPIRGYLDGAPLGRLRSMEARVSSVASVELAFTPNFDLSAKLLRSLFPPAEETW